jgi:hypothetical protein
MPAQQAAVSGFAPFESPWRRRMVLTLLPLDAPLGFALLRLTRGNLDQDFARSPLSRFTIRREPPNTPAPQSFSELPPVFLPSRTGKLMLGEKGLSRVFAPSLSWTFERNSSPGYGFTFRRAGHYCQPPGDLWGQTSLSRRCSGSLRCRAFARHAAMM